ncbi:MAG TPA: hypothetical protein DD434_09915 [Bacteroidales bacterium]|jgi:glycosyltransferase involved in cell wall biosynthesis|nr:hypothetical protein [Bacteroidales bacterium]
MYNYYIRLKHWKDKMKILQVAPHFKPYVGGQEIYIYNLSKKLVEMGHSVHVITSNYPKSFKYEQIDGITIERKKMFMRPLRNPISLGFFDIGKIANNYDVVHIHNLYAFSSLVATYYKTKLDFPLILTTHGKLNFGVNYKDFLVKQYSKKVASKILDRVNLITVFSESQRQYIGSYEHNILSKIKILPNAIDLDLFKDLDANFCEDEGNCFTFLYVGQLIKRKGLKWLINAFRLLVDSYDNEKQLKLVLVGDGQQRENLEKMVKKMGLSRSVDFKGIIKDKAEIAAIYKNSDVFVLPSLSEGFPTVILEAMYFGLPVIATDILGIKEHFESCISLVPPRNAEKLAEAMKLLLDPDELFEARKTSKKVKKLIEEKYSWRTLAQEYEKIYKTLC